MGNGKDAELEASLILKQNINYLETPQMLVLISILLGSKVPLVFCEKNARSYSLECSARHRLS